MSFEDTSKKMSAEFQAKRVLRHLEADVQRYEDQDERITSTELADTLRILMDRAGVKEAAQARFWSSLVNKPKLFIPGNDIGYPCDKLLEIGRMKLVGVGNEMLLNKLKGLGVEDNMKQFRLCLIDALAEVVKKHGGSKPSKRS